MRFQIETALEAEVDGEDAYLEAVAMVELGTGTIELETLRLKVDGRPFYGDLEAPTRKRLDDALDEEIAATIETWGDDDEGEDDGETDDEDPDLA